MEKEKYIAAVDLGCSHVAVVVGSKDPDGKLNIVDCAVKPMQGVTAGDITNIGQVTASAAEAVGEVEKRLGIGISEVYTGISGQHIQCARNSYYVYVGRDGEISEQDVESLGNSMRNVQPSDGMTILDRIPQNYLVDGTEETTDPVGMFGQRLDATFNFIVGSEKVLERHEKAFAKLGLRKKSVFINAVASAEAVVTPDEKELGVAVLDIGAGTTDLCIYYDNIIRYVGVIPIGSDAINKDIRSCSIPERCVENLKITHGYASPDVIPEDRASKVIIVKGRTPRENKEISFRNLATIIEARLLDIIEFAREEIREAGYEHRLGLGLVLTGGGALLRDIDVLFHEKTGYDVRIAVPDMYVNEASREAASDPSLATAVGLLLRALQTDRVESVDPQTLRKSAEPADPQPQHTAAAAGVAEPEPDDTPEADPQHEKVNPEHGSAGLKRRGKKEGRKEEKKGWFNKVFGAFDDMFKVIDEDEDERI